MIAVKEPVDNWFDMLHELYSCDVDLTDKYHVIAPSDAVSCAKRTVNDLIDISEVSIYSIRDDDNLVGWFGVENYMRSQFLTGFFIDKRYRGPDRTVKIFRNIMFPMFDGDILCSVYPKNTRAIRFLKTIGEVCMENSSIFTVKIYNTCH